MTIQDLHRLAYRFLPKGQVHDLLHDYAAERFSVASLKDCNAWQLERIADWVRSRNPQSVPARRDNPKSARPRGRQRPEGVLVPASDRQLKFLVSLLKRLIDETRLTREQAVAAGVRFIRDVIGDDFAWPADGPTDAQLDTLVSGVLQARHARLCINRAIAELKRRNQWSEPGPVGPNAAPGVSARRHTRSAPCSG